MSLPDPRATLDKELATLAVQIREHPTVPADSEYPMLPMPQVFDDTVAAKLPPKHCAFKGCSWQLPWHSVDAEPMTERRRGFMLIQHGLEVHMVGVSSASALLSIMHFIIAPIASYSIDRKCLRDGAEAMSGDRLQSLVCFLCAGNYP